MQKKKKYGMYRGIYLLVHKTWPVKGWPSLGSWASVINWLKEWPTFGSGNCLVKEWPTFGCGVQFGDFLPGQAVSNGLLLDAVGHACMPVLDVGHPTATDAGDRVPNS